MSTISGVSGAMSMTGPGLPTGAGLDGETLLAYCAMQLNDINGSIKERLAEQQRARENKSLLNQLKTMINVLPNGGHYSVEQKHAILTKYAEVIRNMPQGATRDALMQSLQSFRVTTCYNDNAKAIGLPNIDGYVTPQPDANMMTGIDMDVSQSAPEGLDEIKPDEVKSRVDELTAVGDEINKNAELDMIGLQQLISQRQMAIQSTTNLMSKLTQSLEAIAANLK